MPLSDIARTIWTAGVDAVRPARLLAGVDLAARGGRPVEAWPRVVVVGAGKAALAMASAVEARWPEARLSGEVTVPHGYPATRPPCVPAPARIAIRTAGHPVADGASADAAAAALHLAASAGPNDLLLVLVSGGGSALWSQPVTGVTPGELADVQRLLLSSGLAIGDVNRVRRRLSATAGGRLAAATRARVVALVLSDVIGDDLATVASGPTVTSHDPPGHAVDVLHEAGLWEAVPPRVRAALLRFAWGESDTSRVTTLLVGSIATALAAAAAEARRRGLAVHRAAAPMAGEAADVGAAHGAVLRGADGPGVWLWGGESTVTLGSGPVGRGGRNQEAALGAALALQDAPGAVYFAAGTDGIDGPTDAAGAWTDAATAARARALGLDLAAALGAHDAYPLLDALGQLVRTGPTHTNVMDLHVGVVGV